MGLRRAQALAAEQNPFTSTLAGTLAGTVAGGSARAAGNLAGIAGLDGLSTSLNSIAQGLQYDAQPLMAPQLDYKSVDGLGSGWDFVKANAAQGLGSMLPMLAGRAVGRAPLALAAGAAPQMGENLGRLDNDAATAGLTELQKFGYAAPTAALQTGLDYIVPSGVLGKMATRAGLPPAAKAGAVLGGSMLTEGVTETGQEALGQGMHTLANPLRDKSQDTEELLQAGVGGAFGGAPVGALQAGAGYVKDKIDEGRQGKGAEHFLNKLAVWAGEQDAKREDRERAKAFEAAPDKAAWLREEEARIRSVLHLDPNKSLEEQIPRASLQTLRQQSPHSDFLSQMEMGDLSMLSDQEVLAKQDARESTARAYAEKLGHTAFLNGEVTLDEFMNDVRAAEKQDELRKALGVGEKKASLYGSDLRSEDMSQPFWASEMRGELGWNLSETTLSNPTSRRSGPDAEPGKARDVAPATDRVSDSFTSALAERIPTITNSLVTSNALMRDKGLRDQLAAWTADWINSRTEEKIAFRSDSEMVPRRIVDALGPGDFSRLVDLAADIHRRTSNLSPEAEKALSKWAAGTKRGADKYISEQSRLFKFMSGYIDPQLAEEVDSNDLRRIVSRIQDDLRTTPNRTKKQGELVPRGETFAYKDQDLISKYQPFFGPNTERVLEAVEKSVRTPRGVLETEPSLGQGDDADGASFEQAINSLEYGEDAAKFDDGMAAFDAGKKVRYTTQDKTGRSFDTTEPYLETRRQELADKGESAYDVSPVDPTYLRERAKELYVEQQYKALPESVSKAERERVAQSRADNLTDEQLRDLTDALRDKTLYEHLSKLHGEEKASETMARIADGDDKALNTARREIEARFKVLAVADDVMGGDPDVIDERDVAAMSAKPTVKRGDIEVDLSGPEEGGIFIVQPNGTQNFFSAQKIVRRMAQKKPDADLSPEGRLSLLLEGVGGLQLKLDGEARIKLDGQLYTFDELPQEFLLSRFGKVEVTAGDALKSKKHRSDDAALGREYIQGGDGGPLKFDSIEKAKAFLKKHSATSPSIEQVEDHYRISVSKDDWVPPDTPKPRARDTGRDGDLRSTPKSEDAPVEQGVLEGGLTAKIVSDIKAAHERELVKAMGEDKAQLARWIVRNSTVELSSDGSRILVIHPPKEKLPKGEAPPEDARGAVWASIPWGPRIFIPAYKPVLIGGKRRTVWQDRDQNKVLDTFLIKNGYMLKPTPDRKPNEGPYMIVELDEAKSRFVRYDETRTEDRKHLQGIIGEMEEMAMGKPVEPGEPVTRLRAEDGMPLGDSAPRRRDTGAGTVAMLKAKIASLKQNPISQRGVKGYADARAAYNYLKMRLALAELDVEHRRLGAMSPAERDFINKHSDKTGQSNQRMNQREAMDALERGDTVAGKTWGQRYREVMEQIAPLEKQIAEREATLSPAARKLLKNPAARVKEEEAPKAEAPKVEAPTAPPRAPAAYQAKEDAKLAGADLIIAPVSTEGYAGDLGRWAQATDKMFVPSKHTDLSGKVVLVSVPGAGRNFNGMETLIRRVKKALEGGAAVRTDNEHHATRSHNAQGEGVLRAALIEAGYSEKVGENYSEWSKEQPAETVESKSSEQTAQGPVPITPETKQSIIDYIAKTLGPKVKLLIGEIMPEAGTWERTGDGEALIKIGANAFDPLGTAFHESMHEFFKRLKENGNERAIEILTKAANARPVIRQLEKLLKDHPAALEQMRNDVEERMAYMYQFWAAGALNLGPNTETFFEKVRNFINKLLGVLSNDEKAEAIMANFFSGNYAGSSVVKESVAAMEKNEQKLLARMTKIRNPNGHLQKFLFTVEGRMLGSKNKAINAIGRMFATVAGENQEQGYLQAVHQADNQMQNKLKRAFLDAFGPDKEKLTKDDIEDIKAALEDLQANNGVVSATDPLLRAIQQNVANVLAEMHAYMTKNDVRRWDADQKKWVTMGKIENFFPRAWDTDELIARGEEFVQRLLTEHAPEIRAIVENARNEVRAGQGAGPLTASLEGIKLGKKPEEITEEDVARAILDRLISTAGQRDIEETPESIGYTPFMKSVNKRTLKWIDISKFADFMQKDQMRVLQGYISQGVKRGEYTKRFGYDGSKLKDTLEEAMAREIDANTGNTEAMDALLKQRKLVEEAQNMGARHAETRSEHNAQVLFGDYSMWTDENIRADVKAREARIEKMLDRLNKGQLSAGASEDLAQLIQLAQEENAHLNTVLEARKAGTEPPPPKDRRLAWMSKITAGKAVIDKSAAQVRQYAKMVQAMEGTLGRDISPLLRNATSWTITYQNVRLLAMTVFSNLIDPLGVVVRGGTMRDAYETYKRGMLEVWRQFSGKGASEADAATKFAEAVGTIEASGFFAAMGGMYGSVYMNSRARQINDVFFRWNGMEALNRGVRIQATQAAVNFFKRHKQDPNEHTARYFEELGITADDIQILEGGSLDISNDKMRSAVMRWVDGAVLRPNAAQRPAWASDPHYAIFFHLKQFTYSFHRVILKRAFVEAKHGNLTPWITLAAAYVPVAIAADTARAIIGNFGDEPEWMKDQGLGGTLAYGVQRSGLLGIPQLGVDAYKDGVFDVAGPAIDQVHEALFTERTFGESFMRALPLNQIVRGATS